MNEDKTFVKCELKFILLLTLGITLLNIVGMLFQYNFISIVISLIIFCFYISYLELLNIQYLRKSISVWI
ncbi:hypothetical protein CRU90_07620 [Arcobacter cloacae]|uniref:Uncharacterized protein n=1 Tax=Arcobacter cloacae TaxID=1054034 RepID=A0A4Q0ZCB7_9BACT|nr:hypothetical protein CRU90_07620 [Arcobacter cloacae]